jgi:arylsulfotransferase ASST
LRAAPLALLLCSLLVAGCGSARAKPVSSHPVAGLHTLDGYQPPKLTITHPATGGVSPGLLFLAEKGGATRPGGPVIADNRGRILWYLQLEHPLEATDFRTQTYRGKPVLTWWQGTISKAGIGRGEYVVYDASYRQIATVKATKGLEGDLHEFQLTPRGTAYISIYHAVPADLSAVGGPHDGWVYDSVIQEIDVSSGDVVFEWHSLDHVPLTESLQAGREPARHATRKRPLDYFHVNSVSDAPGGRVLVSGRNTSAVYLLARDGSVVWRLGGKRSDFGPPAAVKFRFQHNARLHPGDLLTLFDNGAIPKVEPYSRALELKLAMNARRVSVAKVFVHPLKISSPFEGNVQLLPDGGALVGWGGVRKVTEFTRAGAVRFEVKLPFGDTYRGYRLAWNGNPGGRPAIAVSSGRVYASWNGRLGIDHWDVLGGEDAQHLARVGTHRWTGLETEIPLADPPPTVAVRAVDGSGRVLGVSDTADS